jgi:hypothetical protein
MIAPTTPPCTPRSMTCAFAALIGHALITATASAKADGQRMGWKEDLNSRAMTSSRFRARI